MTEFGEHELKLILRAELAEFQIKLVDLFAGRGEFVALRDEVHQLTRQVRELQIPDEQDITVVARRELVKSRARNLSTWDRVLVAFVALIMIGGFILQIKIASSK